LLDIRQSLLMFFDNLSEGFHTTHKPRRTLSVKPAVFIREMPAPIDKAGEKIGKKTILYRVPATTGATV
jgi:hypothetical protein